MKRFSLSMIALTLTAATSLGAQRVTTTEADVQFMRGMIAHHQQAVTMAAMVPARTARKDLNMLAQRIDASQKDEIAMMKNWLMEHAPEASGTGVHDGHDNAGSHEMLMPGMLTTEEMRQLEKASGAAFEQLFLRGMIKHHEGALTMVTQLFATNGAGQEAVVFRFASDVDADQRAEIARMRTLLVP